MANFVVKGAQALTEDLSWFAGAIVGCGEASALVIRHIMTGEPISPGQLTNLIQSAAQAGQLSGAGHGQTIQNVQWDLAQGGVTSRTVGGGQVTQSWLDSLLQKGIPVEIGVNNGSALTGEPSALRGHFVTLVGENSSGFIVADPNTAASKSGNFVTDTFQQIMNANPFGAVFPTGAGPGTTGANPCGPQPDPKANPQAYAQWLLCQVEQQTNNNPVGTALQGAGDYTGQIAGGIFGGLSQFFVAPFKALGITTFADFLWRVGLLLIAIIALLIGIKSVMSDMGSQAK